MKLDLTQVFKGFDGKPFKEKYMDGEEIKERDYLLRAVCTEALLAEDSQANGAEQVKRFGLALRMNNAETIDITVEEGSLLKKRIGDVFKRPIITGQALKMIEGKQDATTDGDK